MPQIWSDEYIWQLHNDADNDICNQLDVIYVRFPLHITPNTPTYTLPDWVRKVDAIYWKGKKVTPISYESMILFQNMASSTDSYYYCFWPTGPKDIRFYPTSALEIYPVNPFVISHLNKWRDQVSVTLNYAVDGSILQSSNYISNPSLYDGLNEQLSPMDYLGSNNYVIVAAWRTPEPSTGNIDYQLPQWMVRRTKKAFVLKTAYAKEGSGQNLKASQYFQGKYEFLIKRFRAIFDGSFVSKRYRLKSNLTPNVLGKRPPKPSLPSNYERVEY